MMEPGDLGTEEMEETLNAEYPAYTAYTPEAYRVDQPRMDTSGVRSAIRSGVEEQREALDTQIQSARDEADKALVRTAFSIGGPSLMKAVTGAPIETGMRQRLQRQYEAEQRASEIEREASMKEAQMEAEAEQQIAGLRQKERQFNQQAETKEQQSLVEGRKATMQQINDYMGQKQAWGRATAKMRQQAAQHARNYGMEQGETLLDMMKFIQDDPTMAANPATRQLLAKAGVTDQGYQSSIIQSALEGTPGPNRPRRLQRELKKFNQYLTDGKKPIESDRPGKKFIAKGGGYTNDPSKAARRDLSASEEEFYTKRQGMYRQKLKGLVGYQMDLGRANNKGNQFHEAAKVGHEEGFFSDAEYQDYRQEAQEYGYQPHPDSAGDPREFVRGMSGRIAPGGGQGSPPPQGSGGGGQQSGQSGGGRPERLSGVPGRQQGSGGGSPSGQSSPSGQGGSPSQSRPTDAQASAGAEPQGNNPSLADRSEEAIQGFTSTYSDSTNIPDTFQRDIQEVRRLQQQVRAGDEGARQRLETLTSDLSDMARNRQRGQDLAQRVQQRQQREAEERRRQESEWVDVQNRQLEDKIRKLYRGEGDEQVLRRQIRLARQSIREMGGQPVSAEDLGLQGQSRYAGNRQ